MSNEYKIVVVGAGGVGKSALTVRFMQGTFVDKYDPTIEDSYRKQAEVDGHAVMFDIMDTAGQEEYHALRDQYMKTAHGFVLVYSITSPSSFEHVPRLKVNIERATDEPDIPVILCANKSDLESERAVSVAEGQNCAKKYGWVFIETSAKTWMNVDEVFFELVRQINKWREEHPDKFVVKKKKKTCVIV